jgi:hypothetical protein
MSPQKIFDPLVWCRVVIKGREWTCESKGSASQEIDQFLEMRFYRFVIALKFLSYPTEAFSLEIIVTHHRKDKLW